MVCVGRVRGNGVESGCDVARENKTKQSGIGIVFQRSYIVSVSLSCRDGESCSQKGCVQVYTCLSPDRAPAVRVGHGSVVRSQKLGLGCGLGTAAEHHTTGEHGGLAAIVGRDFGPGRVDEDAGLASPLAAGRLEVTAGAFGGGSGGARGRGVGGGEGESRRTRIGGTRAASGLLGDAGEGRGRSCWRRELGENGGHPGGCADLVGKHGEDLLLLLLVLLKDLLGEGLAGRTDGELGAERRLGADGDLDGCSWFGGFSRPDIDDLILASNGDACWVDEEIEFAVTEESDPVEPLDVGGSTGGPDGPGGEASGRKGHAATARAPNGFCGDPGGGVVGDEVGLEHGLEFNESRGCVGASELGGEECDCMGDSESDRSGGHWDV
jgi:hypothetical protein